jgi:hypothetical protein
MCCEWEWPETMEEKEGGNGWDEIEKEKKEEE